MPKNSNHKHFIDRVNAAEQLYDSIPKDFFKNRDIIIVALSEGGVILADVLAQKLDCSMDILLSESVLAPNNPELSIAKVTETQEVLIHRKLTESFNIEEKFIYREAKRVYDDKILNYLYRYRKGGALQSVNNKAVILVDECIETDFTSIVAIKSMISLQAKNIYMATPILDEASYESLMQISDGIFYTHRIKDYISVEYYYENLEKPEFSELERILKRYE